PATAEAALAASEATTASDRVRLFLALGGEWNSGNATTPPLASASDRRLLDDREHPTASHDQIETRVPQSSYSCTNAPITSPSHNHPRGVRPPPTPADRR